MRLARFAVLAALPLLLLPIFTTAACGDECCPMSAEPNCGPFYIGGSKREDGTCGGPGADYLAKHAVRRLDQNGCPYWDDPGDVWSGILDCRPNVDSGGSGWYDAGPDASDASGADASDAEASVATADASDADASVADAGDADTADADADASDGG